MPKCIASGDQTTVDSRLRRPCRVVVVDSDDVNRNGLAVVLGASPHITVVAALTHQEAVDMRTLWHGVDAVIIDPVDHRQEGDQFPGVAVVRQVRAIRPSGDLLIIVITGHFFDDALRRRMREARADYFYHRADVADAARLRRIVLAAGRARGARGSLPAPADPEALIKLGVTDSTRVNRAVQYALEIGLEHELRERREPRSRRWLRLRHGFNAEARLTPMTSDGRLPEKSQKDPSLPQISRFLQWAMKIKFDRVSVDEARHHGADDLAQVLLRVGRAGSSKRQAQGPRQPSVSRWLRWAASGADTALDGYSLIRMAA